MDHAFGFVIKYCLVTEELKDFILFSFENFIILGLTFTYMI